MSCRSRSAGMLFVVVACALAVAVPALAQPVRARRTQAQPARKPPAVPQGFVGMNLSDPFFQPIVHQTAHFKTIVSAGVQSVRVVFNWAQAQPTDGGPISFDATDQVVEQAASHGLTVMPVVLYTPQWDAAPHADGTTAIPQDDGPYADYVKALALRYGPGGSYWLGPPPPPGPPPRVWGVP